MQTMPIDTKWFKAKLAERQLSQRQLAKLLGLDPGAVSLMFHDQRKMTNKEAHLIASTIGVPVTEVLRHAGIAVTDDVRTVPITAEIDARGNLSPVSEDPPDRVDGPVDCPIGTFAVRVNDMNSLQHRWLLFIDPIKQEPEGLVRRMCMATFSDGGQQVGLMMESTKAGLFDLKLWPSGDVRDKIQIERASRVIWVKPA